MDFDEISKRISEAKSLVVSTGAGISSPSGVPTFRGKDGLWKNYRAEDLATPEAFRENPERVWEWYNWRREIISKCEPNPAHTALVELEGLVEDFTLITQNVDGLHTIAGSENIFEIHGNIWRIRCAKCGKIEFDYNVPVDPLPPVCDCGNLYRPDVVWFGESLDGDILGNSYRALEGCDVFISIGTSSIVMPASQFPLLARSRGAYLVEINLDTTPLSAVMDGVLKGDVAKILPEIVKVLKNKR
jgi:NAD-dependent deacetylase